MPTKLIYWIIGLFMGVLASLLASYLKPSIDTRLNKYLKKRRQRNEKRQTEWNRHLSLLTGDIHKQSLYYSIANTNFLFAIFFLVLAIFLFSMSILALLQTPEPHSTANNLSTAFSGFIGMICLIFSMRQSFRGFYYLNLLSELKHNKETPESEDT